MIIYRLISTRDPEYALEKDLRNRVLRLPLGLVLSEDDLRDEDRQLHFAAMDSEGRVVGCVLVVLDERKARIRQIAIDESLRGRGIGTGLMKRAEEAIRDRDIPQVTLHARVTARGFFERLGYAAASEVFKEVTIPHVAMVKDLSAGER